MAMEAPKFLSEKYKDLPGSKPVERAVHQRIRDGEPGPANKDERVDVYMDRLEHITRDERGFSLLKHKILDRFSINTESEETLAKIAHGLYESEKRIAIEQGRGGDIENLETTHDITEHYKPLVQEKAEIQRKTLSSWLDYLQENDAMHPMWFRYLVVRNLEKMGMLDKEKVAYSKRASATVAPFPELNSEALGWVYQRLTNGASKDDFQPADQNTAEEREQLAVQRQALEHAIQIKDFSKLYAVGLVETVGSLNRESLEGEWRTYDQGSDSHVLESDLHNKGTGWCTATGSAQSQLQAGDFMVYYTKGVNGAYTEPRIAIRMEGDHVAEVRGVDQRQELEPELVDIAQTHYQSFPGGDSYDKRAHDMKEMTRLVQKQEKNEEYTRDELVFLYELNAPIEGFGYEKDPRVEDLRGRRDAQADIPIVFGCAPEQIARNEQDLAKSDIKAYVGALEPGIFQKLPASLEHVYTSFPEGRIRFAGVEIGGKSKRQLERELQDRNINVSGYTRYMMNNRAFTTLRNSEQATIVRLHVSDIGFERGATMQEIYARAQELGLELCPAEVGPQMRLQYADQPLGEWFLIGMQQISGAGGGPGVFELGRSGGGLWLRDYWDYPGHRWNPDREFAFRLRKVSSAL